MLRLQQEAIYLVDDDGKRRIVVDFATRIPGSQISFFYLNYPSMNTNTDVVFLGSTIRVSKLSKCMVHSC